MNELNSFDHDADNLPKGKNSTKGMGRIHPGKSEFLKDVEVPYGPIVSCKGVIKLKLFYYFLLKIKIQNH